MKRKRKRIKVPPLSLHALFARAFPAPDNMLEGFVFWLGVYEKLRGERAHD
jgi:hypothetical protein